MATATKKTSVKKEILTSFRMRIRSRHPSHSPLRTSLKLLPFKSVMRLGSTTEVKDSVSNGGTVVEINTVNAIRNSANKMLMKECFDSAGVKTADWFHFNGKNQLVTGSDETVVVDPSKLPFPVVVKHIYGSRGSGNYLCKDVKEFNTLISNRDRSNYIVEKFYNYNREYRLHVTKDGCFYTCRKVLKKDTPEKDRWYKNDSNSSWILEENELFDKPANWDAIISECVKALHSTELDICSFDVRVQSARDSKDRPRKEIDFIIIECNSASSFGKVTLQKYLETVPKVAIDKAIKCGIIRRDGIK